MAATQEQRDKVTALKAALYDELSPWLGALTYGNGPDPSSIGWRTNYNIVMKTYAEGRKKIDKLIDSFPE